MESYKIENVSFAYPSRENKALCNISLSVNRGEFVTLCGKSGCGKTTLLRLLKTSLAPAGTLSGKIFFNGKPLSEADSREQASQIGFVMQSPDNQLVTDKVWHELAFGLESLGFSTAEIRTRVSEMASFFGIQTWFHKKVTELSGGQKQLLNLASVMVMQPSVLILDEPSSQLDPIAAQEFMQTLKKINRELGTTVILSEHRLEEAFPISDRAVVMDSGKIIADAAPKKAGEILKALNHDMYLALPAPMRVYGAVENGSDCPVDIRGGRIWLEKYAQNNPVDASLIPQDGADCPAETAIEVKDAYFRYEKNLPDVIKGMNIRINKGELFAFTGGNGTGKTTALSLISGLNTPYRGEVLINGKSLSKISKPYNGLLGVLPQNPQTLFVKNTVYLDLMEMLSEEKISKQEKEIRVKNISGLCRIENLLQYHPYDLSGGEQQRAALAKVLLSSPKILLLDEPTKGLDAHFKKVFADIIKDLKAKGVTVAMVSHDIEFCAEHADRCAMFFDGSITSEGKPREFFSGNNFYTTSACKMARTVLPKAVLAEDITAACGVNTAEKQPLNPTGFSDSHLCKTDSSDSHIGKTYSSDSQICKTDSSTKTKQPKHRKKPSKKALAASLLTLLAVPLTVFAGVFFLNDRKYYFISLLIILETMIPFFMLFESGRPKARELVTVSVLCAVGVAGRAAFFMLPQFKPVAAVVIIAGVCFGGETGFLVGAVTSFVSNFFFGQGPWTPWQMLAFGTVGFTAGLLFHTGFLPKSKAPLCIFGALAVFLIYGGIMNPASVIMFQEKITKEMILSACFMGIPFDLIHGASTALFLWFISEPMIEKLERIKVKYALIER